MEPVDRDFHHPYQPYDIQKTFMTALYECIEEGKVGIFESPTGMFQAESKVASTQLIFVQARDEQRKAFLSVNDQENAELDSEPEWILEYARGQRAQAVTQKKLDVEARLTRARNKELRQTRRYENGEPQSKRIKAHHDQMPSDVEMETRYLLGDYDSDSGATEAKAKTATGLLSETNLELLEKLGMNVKPSDEQGDLQPIDERKIYYCSRTHSQLTQFVNEVRRVKIPPAFGTNTASKTLEEEIKHLSLGSRRNLCINQRVSNLGSAIAINERCLELQQSGVSPEHKCTFLPTKENQVLVNEFRDYTLAQIRDIEDLGKLGKRVGICPYYASRATIKPSEIITLPYPLLLQKSAREALDISLKGHVVIIDEAHNLMDAISNISSITVSSTQLKCARAQLGLYLQRFRNKLKGKNRVYVTQVVRLLDSLSAYMEGKARQSKVLEGVISIGDLMAGKGVDQINLYKLMHYLQESKLARKVEGYIIHTAENQSQPVEAHTSTTPVLTHIQGFFQTLTNPAAEGRFFFSRAEDNDMCIKYMLLDPTYHFREIVDDARAVILAGGTMSPMEDYIRHLLGYLEPERLKLLSCGHVIPDGNLAAWPVTKGPSNIDFDFTYEKRDLVAMMEELGNCLIELARIIPDGMVVFFPSYAYLQQVVSRWQAASLGSSTSIWDRISKYKTVFRESKGNSAVDDVLRDYANAIDTGKGALLLSVVGGKMSEGINFSDKLGRGVIVVGLPFPNIQSVEWKSKLEYIENASVSRGNTKAEGKNEARDFYENACMRAVNQCIGRAIRHQKDYASIILLDRRYDTARIADKLPGWIKQRLVRHASDKPFAEVIRRLVEFFKVDRGL